MRLTSRRLAFLLGVRERPSAAYLARLSLQRIRNRRDWMVPKAPKPRSPTERGNAILQQLLSELARVLLQCGMTPKRFGELARYAFVRTAADMSRLRNGRVNQSRIAAQTGLTRAEVKRTLSRDVIALVTEQAPLDKVVKAWLTDRQFGSPGRPRSLRVSGSRDSFAHLVRKYAGDIPHRAVLDELCRLGAVSSSRGRVRLARSLHLQRRQDLAFLAPVMPALIDALRVGVRDARTKSSSVYRLSLPLLTDIDLAIARRRCVSSAKSMLDGLRDSLGTQITLPVRTRKQTQLLTITVLVAENREPTPQPIR